MKTMKVMRKLILALVLMVLASNLFAQTNDYKTGSLLWKVSGNGLDKPSYILGTFHAKTSTYLDKIPGAKAHLDASEQVIGEIIMADMMAQASKIQQKMMMPADTTYKMLYNDSDYQIVSDGIKSILGAGLDQMGVLTPSGIQISILNILMMKNYPEIMTTPILDAYIQSVGLEQQKPVIGLETMDHQIYVLFESSSLQRQADALLCAIKASKGVDLLSDEMLNDLKKLETLYDNGDLNGLLKLLKENPCPDPQNEYIINKARNDAWMKKLPELMKDKSSFIAVGALHIAGEEGLLNQLEQAGYTVEAVKN